MWDITGRHRNYDPCVWRHRATEEQKRVGWETWVRTVLDEAHRRQVGETMDALSEGSEGFHKSHPDR